MARRSSSMPPAKRGEATGDELAHKVARDAFDWLERMPTTRKHGGYFESIRRDGTPILAWDKDAPIAQRLDRLGRLLRLQVDEFSYSPTRGPDRALEGRRSADREGASAGSVLDRPGPHRRRAGALNLYLTPDWQAIPAHDSFGHDVETAFLLVEAGRGPGDARRPQDLAGRPSLVDHALDWGWDDDTAGFYDKGESFGARRSTARRSGGPQAEGLERPAALAPKIRHGTDRYWKAFLKQWDFIEKHLLDPSTAAGMRRRPATASSWVTAARRLSGRRTITPHGP